MAVVGNNGESRGDTIGTSLEYAQSSLQMSFLAVFGTCDSSCVLHELGRCDVRAEIGYASRAERRRYLKLAFEQLCRASIHNTCVGR